MDKIYRSGIGLDVHKLVEGRKCIIGGVDIPYEKGLLGHSDADVLLHAISDALLGAAGLGDIGTYFPDTDPAFKGADSLELLRKVGEEVKKAGYDVRTPESEPAQGGHEGEYRPSAWPRRETERHQGYDHRKARLYRSRRGNRLPGHRHGSQPLGCYVIPAPHQVRGKLRRGSPNDAE